MALYIEKPPVNKFCEKRLFLFLMVPVKFDADSAFAAKQTYASDDEAATPPPTRRLASNAADSDEEEAPLAADKLATCKCRLPGCPVCRERDSKWRPPGMSREETKLRAKANREMTVKKNKKQAERRAGATAGGVDRSEQPGTTAADDTPRAPSSGKGHRERRGASVCAVVDSEELATEATEVLAHCLVQTDPIFSALGHAPLAAYAAPVVEGVQEHAFCSHTQTHIYMSFTFR